VLTAAVLTALAVTNRASDVLVLLAGTVALGLVGLLDDRFNLPALPRLAAQVLVPFTAVLIAADRSGPALGAALVISVVWCAGYVNAFNFMDGINGISGSQAAIAGSFLALVARDVGNQPVELASWAIAGAAVGFLPFNAVRPRIFLGDVGSYGIGFLLAGTALLLWKAGAAPIVLLGPFLLYLADTSVVLVRRWRRGASLTEAHREHAYQLLTQSGWSHLAVAALCAGVTLLTSALMLAVTDATLAAQLVALLLSLVVVAGYLWLPIRFFPARSAQQ
jgi:UDP-GlcNAc:undecaprenyl-phosphate/decaprenyl-phosphate GlcNAc-1-phosphate transferase